MSTEGDSFLSRWARRKAEAETVAVEAPPPVPEALPDPSEEDTRPDAEILADLGLPDPETLTLGDDIKGFMQDAVPAHLRRLALRKLWTTNPVLANLDSLVDYGDDFTDAALVVENLQTAYQVGKGIVVAPPDADDAEAEDVVAEDVVVEDEAHPATDPAPEDIDATMAEPEALPPEQSVEFPDDALPTDSQPVVTAAGNQSDENPDGPPRRRMRFRAG